MCEPQARQAANECSVSFRKTPGRQVDQKHEAKVIALRLGKPLESFANWSLRLLAERAVELGLTQSTSHETVRETLKRA